MAGRAFYTFEEPRLRGTRLPTEDHLGLSGSVWVCFGLIQRLPFLSLGSLGVSNIVEKRYPRNDPEGPST